MAWFEGTATTNAEVRCDTTSDTSAETVTNPQILTIEADSALAAVSRQAFTACGYDARITIKEGWAAEVYVAWGECRVLEKG